MNRHHVHLSSDTETASKVGQRHGKPVIFKIKTAEMLNEGFEFFISANGVWLVAGSSAEVFGNFVTVNNSCEINCLQL